MEPILLYGVPQGCSFGTIVTLEWLGQPYRLCRVRMPDDLADPAYDALNPVRETPVLVTSDGRPLSESAAILAHLAAKDASHRLGGAPGSAAQDRIAQALAFLNTTFFSAFSPLWTAYEMAEDPPVQTVLRDLGRRQVVKAHEQLERMLDAQEWLAGDERSIADAYFSGIARWADYHRVLDPADYPRLQALRRRLEADPAVQFAMAIEAGESPAGAGGFAGHVPLPQVLARLSSPSSGPSSHAPAGARGAR